MHAIRLHEFGPAENLRYESVADPEPGTGQVRIAVAAAGVHLVDTTIRAGQRGPFPAPELPAIPGREVAGRVDALGDGVDPSWLGKRVVGHLGMASSGYAELAVASVDSLHELPDDLTEDTAVAMIGTGRTTMGILALANLSADDVVLVTAAAGGIGNLLVQAGRNAGATVVGVAGGQEKIAKVRELGATVAVDYTEPDWPQAVRDALDGREVTVVLDGVGGAIGRSAFELLGAGGRLLIFGWSSGEPVQLTSIDLVSRSVTASGALGIALFDKLGGIRALEDRALAAVAAGELVPLAGTAFPLAQAAEAHRALESRGTVGKVVLHP
ncbi:zinc-binding dehydrogenase [Solihabitans fulvus]|uniref:Zinc-binding dehydrogenase n=1 Tax=Solihabitans fulvus TaxID=1892852 RepID=A0A5B2WZS9_9PSEU|nr:zinc-binding dehydrogenase [Solihabitans fulvus]KAA2256322.1 zinc-binding dehydrogenase [Solihabitans fulvus]